MAAGTGYRMVNNLFHVFLKTNMCKHYCNIIHLSEVRSTNEHARALLEQDAISGNTLILADFQTAGRGHGRNKWESSPGENILCSLVLFPAFLEIGKQFSLSKAISLGIIDFLSRLEPACSFMLKWPNDIYHGDRKLGGILINNEIMGNRFRHVTAGIGININQQNFSSDIPNPVSLKQISGKAYKPADLAGPLAESILERIESLEKDPQAIERDYLEKLYGKGEWKDFLYHTKKIKAKIEGVNEYGHLVLETTRGHISCEMKEVSFLM